MMTENTVSEQMTKCAEEMTSLEVGSHEWLEKVDEIRVLSGAQPIIDVFWISQEAAYNIMIATGLSISLIVLYKKRKQIKKFLSERSILPDPLVTK